MRYTMINYPLVVASGTSLVMVGAIEAGYLMISVIILVLSVAIVSAGIVMQSFASGRKCLSLLTMDLSLPNHDVKHPTATYITERRWLTESLLTLVSGVICGHLASVILDPFDPPPREWWTGASLFIASTWGPCVLLREVSIVAETTRIQKSGGNELMMCAPHISDQQL